MKRQRRIRNLLVDGGLSLLLLATVVGVTALYVSRERTFYAWDYAGYQDIASGVVTRYRESPEAALEAVALSLARDYTAVFALPLLPWLLLFGESRLVYELALAVTYLVPFVVVLGGIAVELLPGRPRAVFWSTVALALLTPMVWAPTLRGYPDTGAALALALAVWIFLRDTTLRRRWQMPTIGMLLAAAIVLRRHFAYAGIAFLTALALLALLRFAAWARRRPRESWLELLASGARIGVIALAAFLTLLLFARPFFERIATTDFNALYASYMQPPPAVLRWYGAAYGWPVWVAAGAGLAMRLHDRPATPAVRPGPALSAAKGPAGGAAFIALFGGLLLLQWAVVVRQLGPHYTLHFTPAVVLGVAALGWQIHCTMRGRPRLLALCVGSLYIVTNTVAGLTPVGVATTAAARPLFAAPWAPLARADYDEVARLVAYLRDQAAGGEPIYIASSSTLLDNDLLDHAERALYGAEGRRLSVLPVPHIDSRDFLPLEMLLRAQYVVVVEPFQHHLGSDRQGVVKVVVDIFAGDEELAGDFVRLPARFLLDDGAVASVFQRTRPTSPDVAVRTLRLIRRYVPAQPAGQPDWIAVGQADPSWVRQQDDHTSVVTTRPRPRGAFPSTTLLYLGSLPERGVLAGELTFADTRCAGVALRLAGADAQGRIADLAEVARRPDDPPAFAIAFPKQDAAAILLDVTTVDEPGASDDCTVTIERLRVLPEENARLRSGQQ